MRESPGRADRRIVVGVNGAAASLTAVRWAAQEARLRQASVHLVFVRDGFRRAPYAGLPEASPADQDDADGRAPLVTAELEAGWIVPPGRLSSELAHGSPAKVLVDRSAGAELLVLGAACPEVQPASEAPHLVGPVARACLHRAACPVVVVATSDTACPPAHIYPAPDATLAGRPPPAVLPPQPSVAGSGAWAQSEALMARTLEVAVLFATAEERLAATFGELAASHPRESARYQALSQAAGGIAARTRQWAEAHAATA